MKVKGVLANCRYICSFRFCIVFLCFATVTFSGRGYGYWQMDVHRRIFLWGVEVFLVTFFLTDEDGSTVRLFVLAIGLRLYLCRNRDKIVSVI